MSHLRFGTFTFDRSKRWLSQRGERVLLGPKVVETLAVLVESAGELVTKEELMSRLWPNQFVEEANLTQNIYRVRRVLAEGGLDCAIETVPCRGYRFVAGVESADSGRASNLRSLAPALAAVFCLITLASFAFHRQPDAFSRLSAPSQRLYRLGRYHWNTNADVTQVKLSLPNFRRVVKLDPRNPLGYSGLADAYLALFDLECDSSLADCPQIAAIARENAQDAVALDPGSAQAHTSMAMVLYDVYRRYSESDAEFQRAIELDPNYALAHHWFANSLVVRGRLGEAESEYRAAVALEPTSPGTYAWLAEDEYFRRDYRGAIANARQALGIDAHRPVTWIVLGVAYEQLGDAPDAIAAFDRLPTARRDAFLAGLYARRGQRDRALGTLHAVGPNSDPAEVALAWDALGERSHALAVLRRSVGGNWMERSFLAMDPRLQPLRSERAFERLTFGD